MDMEKVTEQYEQIMTELRSINYPIDMNKNLFKDI